MKKLLYVIFGLIFVEFLFSETHRKKIEFPVKNPIYNDFRKTETEVWIKYDDEIGTYINGIDEKYKIYESIKYYFVRENKETYIGKVDGTGLYDKNNKLLRSIRAGESKVLGLAENTIKYPESPNVVIKTNKGKIKDTDPFVLVHFDLENDTVMVYDPMKE